MKRLATIAAGLVLGCIATAAPAADLPTPPPVQGFVDQPRLPEAPPRPRVAHRDGCAYVEVRLHNWDQDAVFRVTAKYGDKVSKPFPAKLAAGGTRLCLPRSLFQADVVEICIGDTSRDKSNSLLIQNQWMQEARANLEKGDVVNPGRPRNFVYNGAGGGPRVYADAAPQSPLVFNRTLPHFYTRPMYYHRRPYYPANHRPSPLIPLVAGVAARLMQAH